MIGILLVVIGVLALPLVWFNKNLTGRKKFLITVVSVTIAAVLFVLSAQLMALLNQRLSKVQVERESIATQIVPKSEPESDPRL